MSRIPEGECEDEDSVRMHNLWMANYARQLKGKPGQAFLRELRDALLALPEKALIEGQIAKGGQVCALGSLALKRRVDAGESREAVIADLSSINVNPNDDDFDGRYIYEWARAVLNAPRYLAWMVPSENDDDGMHWTPNGIIEVTPEQRYERMLRWVERCLEEQPT
jgi:hypothetical protein